MSEQASDPKATGATWAFVCISAVMAFLIVTVIRVSSCAQASCEMSVRAYELCIRGGSGEDPVDAVRRGTECEPLLTCQ